jgi:hypothetical protein
MRVLVLVLCFAGIASSARAECLFLRLADYVASDRIAAMFHGTVFEVNPAPVGQEVTLKVDRVWKGDVTEVFTVYNKQGETENGRYAEAVTFELGKAYLVAAHLQTPVERGLFRLEPTEPPTYGTGPCDVHAGDAIAVLESVPGQRPAPGGRWFWR